MNNKNLNLLPPIWVIILIISSLGIWLLIELKEIVTLLIIGGVISYLFEPALKKLESYKIPRALGIVLLSISLLLLFTILVMTAFPVIKTEYLDLKDNYPDYILTAKERLIPLIQRYQNYLPEQFIDSPFKYLEEYTGVIFENLGSGLLKALLGGYSVTLTIINLALLPFIVFYISVDFPLIKNKFKHLFPYHLRDEVEQILSEINFYISSFVRGQFVIASILFVLYLIGLKIVDIQLWFLIAFISGFGNMIPYFGFFVGIVLASIMSLVTFGTWSSLFQIWAVYAIVQFLEGTFISPKVLGNKIGISPLIIILSIIAGGTLFGLLGIFLAVPMAAALKVIFKYFLIWLNRNFSNV